MKLSAEQCGHGVFQLTTILDLEGLSLSIAKNLGTFKTVSIIDQNYYPEFLGAMYIVNCPSYFPTLWALCKPFIDKETQSKIHVLGSNFKEVLQSDLGKENLPEKYGGTHRCENGCIQDPVTHEQLKNEPPSTR